MKQSGEAKYGFFDPSNLKLGVCYLLAGLGILYCFMVAATEGTEHHIQLLICVLASAIGWCVGMYLTPSSEGESKVFSEFGKVVLLLGAGIGIAKTPDLVNIAHQILGGDSSPTARLRVLLFACLTLLFGTCTYIARLNFRNDDEERREKREKLLAEVRKSLDAITKAN